VDGASTKTETPPHPSTINHARKKRQTKMRPNSKKIAASAATLFTSVFFMMTAPAVHADEYCITNGAQAAHGCGFSSFEQCQASSAGVGGMCMRVPSAQSSGDALAYAPKHPNTRSRLRSSSTPKAPPANDE
jgi:Protein of unknown function (DUF3551)